MPAESVNFSVEAITLTGSFYAAPSDGPHPAALLLHGIPGNEKNADIAARLQAQGWNVLIPHFRGAWGSGGEYDMLKQPDDALAALDYLLSRDSTDGNRVAVVGYSLGTRAAFAAAHRDPRVGAIVAISGVADYGDLMLDMSFYQEVAPLLRGATPEALVQQWAKLGVSENPINLIGSLSQPILIVHGTDDDTVPYFMASALTEASRGQALLCPVAGADHDYSQHRAELVELVTTWLDAWAQ